MKFVCFVGASSVEGQGDEETLGWVGRLAALQREAGRPIIPYNLGVRGQTLREMSRRAVTECTPRIRDRESDLIVLGTGMNDLARVGSGSFRTPRRRALEDFDGLIGGLAELAPLLVVGPFPVLEAKMPISSSLSGMSFDFRNSDIEEAVQSYAQVCATQSVPFLDLFAELQEDSDYMDGLAANDGLHSNGKGYQAIARRVYDWSEWRRYAADKG